MTYFGNYEKSQLVACFNWYFAFMDGNSGDQMHKWLLTSQKVIFIFVNYLEIVGIYFTYKGLTKTEQNKMNIMREMMWVSITWTGFSLAYFFINQFLGGEGRRTENNAATISTLKVLVLICILGRNLGVFAAQTV